MIESSHDLHWWRPPKGGRPRQSQEIRAARQKTSLLWWLHQCDRSRVICDANSASATSRYGNRQDGKFYSPQQVFEGLDRAAESMALRSSLHLRLRGRSERSSVRAVEADKSDYTYVLETNGRYWALIESM